MEQRLGIVPPELEESIKFVNVQERSQILEFAKHLSQPEVSVFERLNIVRQLQILFGAVCRVEPVEA